jgi:signal transduction histidine kinase/ActR/RegA family two-component response regulator
VITPDEKYRLLADKYDALVRKYRRDVAERSSSVLLALAAMRASETALAAVRGGAVHVRNDRWRELARHGDARWRPLGGAAEHEVAGLDEIAVEEARAAEQGGVRVFARRWSRGERVFDVRLERLASGPTDVVLASATDVTRETRREEELTRAREARFEQERLRSVGELASGVAHDLNSTLHALRLRVERLSQAGATGATDVTAILRILAEASGRVRRLQELGLRREDRPPDRVDLAAAVAGAVEAARLELVAHPPGARVEIVTRVRGPVFATADAVEVQGVLAALVLNGVEAMPRGGRVIVETVGGPAGVVVTVSDEGPGVRPEHLPRLFDPFFTTKGARGTGLGLALAYGVMRRLGGAIEAMNGATGGAIFTLRFPPVTDEPRAGAPPAAGDGPRGLRPLPRRRVLVVDDDEDVLEAARAVLEMLGQHVETAGGGADAIARVDAGERYDVVLTDLGMPGTSGWEVAERLHAIAPAMPVWLVTGWARELRVDDPRCAHLAGVLPKPLDIDELRRVISAAPFLEEARGPENAEGLADASTRDVAPERPTADERP